MFQAAIDQRERGEEEGKKRMRRQANTAEEEEATFQFETIEKGVSLQGERRKSKANFTGSYFREMFTQQLRNSWQGIKIYVIHAHRGTKRYTCIDNN